MQPAKVAMPAVAVTGFVVQPLSEPPPALFASESVTVVVLSPVTTLLFVSSTLTTGCVAKALPPAAPTGCVVKTSLVAVPALTVTLGWAEKRCAAVEPSRKALIVAVPVVVEVSVAV